MIRTCPVSACSLPGPRWLAALFPSSPASKKGARTTLKWQLGLNNQRGLFVWLAGARIQLQEWCDPVAR